MLLKMLEQMMATLRIRVMVLVLVGAIIPDWVMTPSPATAQEQLRVESREKQLRSTSDFVFPGSKDHQDKSHAVWGFNNGIRIGIRPTPGPEGLIRVYAPYLEQEFPRVVNFISIEPAVPKRPGRGQSELEISRMRPEERGLTFWASNTLSENRPMADGESLPTGTLSADGQVLTVFIHCERFANDAKPIIECRFHNDRPYEVEFILHAAEDSGPMQSCTLSSTMANYGQLRQLHLAERTVTAKELWTTDEALDPLGFMPWHSFPSSEMTSDGSILFVAASSDMTDPKEVVYADGTAPHWKYQGIPAIHYWKTAKANQPRVAVNGRRTYWMSQSPIPGGSAFENFELAMPFREGLTLQFGVKPAGSVDGPAHSKE